MLQSDRNLSGGKFVRKQDERRLLENELIFKQVNKDAEDFMYDIGVQHHVAVPFYCECSAMTCHMRIELTPAEYEQVHKNPKHFIVVPGHQVPAIEKVVERHDNYAVVEKIENMPQLRDAERRLKEL